MKNITQAEIQKLIRYNYIKNTDRGYVLVSTGSLCGFYKTKNKRYIEDKLADLVKRLD